MFSTLCHALENISSALTKKEKVQKLLDYYENLKQSLPGEKTASYDVLRLILPKFDKARSSYGLKENALAKKYIESLCIAKNSVEGQRLLKFKALKGSKDLPDTLFHVLKNRCHGEKDFSIREINDILDSIQLGERRHNENVNQVINKITRNMSALHQKWLCRIMLKDLHLGISGINFYELQLSIGLCYFY